MIPRASRPGRRTRSAVGGDQLGLALIGFAQNEGPGEVGAIAVDHRRQIDQCELAALQRRRTQAAVKHARFHTEVDVDGRARPLGAGLHHRVRDFGGNLLRRHTRAEHFMGAVHSEARDLLGFGQQRDFLGLLDHPEWVHHRVRRDNLDHRVDLAEHVDQEGRRVEPLLDADLELAADRPIGGSLGAKLA